MMCNEERDINMAVPQCSIILIELNNTKIVVHQITCHLIFICLMTYIYIYMSYHTADLQMLHFIYLFNKYTY